MTLPILLSVPHAGTATPSEVRALCRLEQDEIVADGDVGAAEIYALERHVAAFLTTSVARAFVDLNRARDDRRKDGVVKTHTCWDVPIYSAPLPDDVVLSLLERHHRPYHEALRALAREPGVRLGVDGHTMAAFGPPVGPDPGSERPAVCLGNADGTCPDPWIRTMATCFEETFQRPVAINVPFSGGYIVRTHAAELPWIQIELSRAEYASVEEKRRWVLAALTAFCERTFTS